MTDHEVNNLFTQLGEDLALATGARSLVSVDDSALPRAASSSSLGMLSPPTSRRRHRRRIRGADSPRRRRSFADAQKGLRRGADGDARVNVDMFMAGIRRHHFLRRIVSHYTLTEPTWAVPRGYDYNRSTTENYAAPLDAGFVGELVDIRARLDADYHGNYGHARSSGRTPARAWACPRASTSMRAARRRSTGRRPSRRAARRSTASARAEPAPVARLHVRRDGRAGKGWVMNWMSTLDILPLRSIVHIDPDRFKQMMPEWAGHLAQELAMRHRLHVWVDGSLRDHGWYEREFDELREAPDA
ncbi:Zeta toxin [Aureococcus anophagefferens]|uniref:Zeta toxin n=1 Tax=Aureococcus anophagefferens TaxID=44056 RepID=A0ABR1GDU2_AURAN